MLNILIRVHHFKDQASEVFRSKFNISLSNILSLIFIVIILFGATYVRFDGITQQGLGGGDNPKYLHEAKLWADGKPPEFMKIFYRPVIYMLQGLAVRAWGYNDYSIKILHGLFDIMSICIMIYIAMLLSLQLIHGAIVALLFAFLPRVIFYTRSEMPHSITLFFVLLTLMFFLLSEKSRNKSKRMFFLFLSLAGFFSGISANTHPDIALLSPGYIVYFLIHAYQHRHESRFIYAFVRDASIFIVAFFLPYAIGALAFGTTTVAKVIYSEMTHHGPSLTSFVKKYGHTPRMLVPFHLFYYSLIQLFGQRPWILFLLCGVPVLIIWRTMKKHDDPLKCYLPAILLIVYAIGFTCIASTFPKQLTRIFIPLLPLVLIFIVYWYSRILYDYFKGYANIILVIIALLLFSFHPKAKGFSIEDKSRFRGIYDILQNEVDETRRLLISPASTSTSGHTFNHDFYFGQNAIYQTDLPLKGEYTLDTLEQLLEPENIAFILITRPRTSYLRPNRPLWSSQKRWLRSPFFIYDPKQDICIIQEFIKNHGGTLKQKTPWGDLYMIPISPVRDIETQRGFHLCLYQFESEEPKVVQRDELKMYWNCEVLSPLLSMVPGFYDLIINVRATGCNDDPPKLSIGISDVQSQIISMEPGIEQTYHVPFLLKTESYIQIKLSFINDGKCIDEEKIVDKDIHITSILISPSKILNNSEFHDSD